MTPGPDDTFIGLGANLGNAIEALGKALEAIARIPASRVIARSSFYRSAPVGFTSQPDYVNAVALIRTRLSAREVLEYLHDIENRFGRTREFRNAPRTLDLDLLLHGTDSISTPELEVPHPRMHSRRFVLEPLAEIAPQLGIPGHGRVADLLRGCMDQPVVRIQLP